MLLLDVGNSALKCRQINDQGVPDQVFSLHQDPQMTAFADYLETISTQAVVVASVSSEAITRAVLDLIAQYNQQAQIRQLFTLPQLGRVKNAYHDYTQLGVDRWLTFLAAVELVPDDVMIIDAGSAITVDLVSQQKGHLGGAILPGFNTALDRFKQLFPTLDYHQAAIEKTDVPGRSTAECIHLRKVTCEDVIQLIDEWLPYLQKPVTIILCGQDAGLIAQRLSLPYRIEADLVFQGMLKQIDLQG